jgi:transcriptional regulator with XRE-family HTH domain
MSGNELREMRLAKGWTQQEAAERFGFKDKSSVSRMENGERDINALEALAIRLIMYADITINPHDRGP